MLVRPLLAAVSMIACCTVGLAQPSAPGPAQVRVVGFSDSFSRSLDDDYGLREGEILKADLAHRVELALQRAGAPAGVVVELTIADAKPNRPTLGQMIDQPGLSYQSFGIGGATVEGRVLSADGRVLATLKDRWYETDIEQAYGRSTWGDAQFAFDRFARKLARAAVSS